MILSNKGKARRTMESCPMVKGSKLPANNPVVIVLFLKNKGSHDEVNSLQKYAISAILPNYDYRLFACRNGLDVVQGYISENIDDA